MNPTFERGESAVDRRRFFAHVARAALGVSAVEWISGGNAFRRGSAEEAGRRRPPRSVIMVFCSGGMSHLDTLDPKPGSDAQGPTKTIQTKTPGVLFGEHFQQLAGVSDQLAVVRAVTTKTGDHLDARYLMRTSYPRINSILHPSFGSWLLHSQGKVERTLPGFVLIGGQIEHPGPGFLDPTLSPMPVASPDAGVANVSRRPGVTPEEFNRRLSMTYRFDQAFKKKYRDPQVAAYDTLYRDAVRLMGSDDLGAFDLAGESDAVRDAYGRTLEGQGCLLARRLVEAGTPIVEVESAAWDHHADMFKKSLPVKAGALDKALASLIKDLAQRGLLETTLVVLTTEFGRTAVNVNAGRDHHPAVFSCVLAGAGIRVGGAYGASDEDGHSPDRDVVTVEDFNTTVAAAAGLPYTEEFLAPNGRPFQIGGGGTPVADLLA